MEKKDPRLYFEDLANKIRTKYPVAGVWFVTLHVKDAALILWKHEVKDPVSQGVLLKTINNINKTLEVLVRKDSDGFVRLMLEPKYMDMQISKTALGGDLISANKDQIDVVINKVLRKQSTFKLLERESIKEALNAGIFGVLPKKAAYYLPHPEVAQKAATQAAPARVEEVDSEEEREIARDIKASQKHEVERMAAARSKSSKDRSSQSLKDKGKSVVQEEPKKKATQAPKEKLLGSNMVAETAWLSRESKTDSNKRKRESVVTPPAKPTVVEAQSSEEEDEDSSEKEVIDTTDSGEDSPPPSQLVNLAYQSKGHGSMLPYLAGSRPSKLP
ncbi:hypothetical protein R1sor_022693 [Riccia sorocarpa]|uniref:Uncharacterized protein n=1 Tax=Riccia sorocarpa TaxID=122646 RepID=A0ABD3GML1_9MARC